ncbi:hypothetical protein GCM10010424_15410 [Streptomyces lienomycini]
MRGLRQQGGRAREESADRLGDGDHQIGREGHQHGDACPAVGLRARFLFHGCPTHEGPTARVPAAHTPTDMSDGCPPVPTAENGERLYKGTCAQEHQYESARRTETNGGKAGS